MRWRRATVLLLAGVALPAAAAGQAEASNARVVAECVSNKIESYCNYDVHVTAGAGEQNAFAIRVTADDVFVRDGSAPLEPGAGCEAEGGGVVCPRLRGSVHAALGDGDDSLVLEESSCVEGTYSCDYVRADGGPGADAIWGGTGADTLRGGPGPDELRGGTGDDLLYDGDSERAPAGDLLDGGEGVDSARYEARRRPVAVDLEAGTGGAAGEDDRLANVENVIGGSGADVLSGDAGRNILYGLDGADVLRGRAGDDQLEPSAIPGYRGHLSYGTYPDAARDVVRCGPGDDAVLGVTELDLMLAGCDRVYPRGDGATFHELAGAAAPPDPVARWVGAVCRRRPCRPRLRLRLARRAGATPAGTVVGERTVTLSRGENPPAALRLNGLGRRLLGRKGRLRLVLRVSAYGRGDYRERPTAFSLETRLAGEL